MDAAVLQRAAIFLAIFYCPARLQSEIRRYRVVITGFDFGYRASLCGNSRLAISIVELIVGPDDTVGSPEE